MADIADKSSALEERQRQWALEDALRRPAEEPELNEAGKRICKECGITIAMMRLAVVPYAVRCMPCQEEFEEEQA